MGVRNHLADFYASSDGRCDRPACADSPVEEEDGANPRKTDRRWVINLKVNHKRQVVLALVIPCRSHDLLI